LTPGHDQRQGTSQGIIVCTKKLFFSLSLCRRFYDKNKLDRLYFENIFNLVCYCEQGILSEGEGSVQLTSLY
jgi:hypothetical protein